MFHLDLLLVLITGLTPFKTTCSVKPYHLKRKRTDRTSRSHSFDLLVTRHDLEQLHRQVDIHTTLAGIPDAEKKNYL